MNFNCNTNNISFQKTLQAHCFIIKDNKPCQCSIYKLSYPEDTSYFYEQSKKWDNNSNYWKIAERNFKKYKKPIFVMEDQNNECIGFMKSVTDKYNKNIELSIIETRPDVKGENNNSRQLKYIGETFIAFLVNLKNANQKRAITVNDWIYNAENFYIKCHFILDPISCRYYMNNENADLLLEQNFNHTHNKINFNV